MNELIVQACVRKVTTLDKAYLPSSVLVELHASLRGEGDEPRFDVVREWRSTRIEQVQQWNGGTESPTLGSEASRQLVEITDGDNPLPGLREIGCGTGLARVAPIYGSELIYLDYQWGYLCGAVALWRYDTTTCELIRARILWMS